MGRGSKTVPVLVPDLAPDSDRDPRLDRLEGLSPAAADLLLLLAVLVVRRSDTELVTIFARFRGQRGHKSNQQLMLPMGELLEAGLAKRVTNHRHRHKEALVTPVEFVPEILAFARRSGSLARLWTSWGGLRHNTALSRSAFVHLQDDELYISSPDRLGQLRVGLELGDAAIVGDALQYLKRAHSSASLPLALTPDPPALWVQGLPRWALLSYVREDAEALPVNPQLPTSNLLALAKELQDKQANDNIAVALALAGRLDEVDELGKRSRWVKEGCELIDHFVRGDYEAAARCGDEAVARMKQRKLKQFRGVPGLVHAWVRAATMGEDPGRALALRKSITHARGANAGFASAYSALACFDELCARSTAPVQPPAHLDPADERHNWCTELTISLCRHWLGYGIDRDEYLLEDLEADSLDLRENGYPGIAREFDALVKAGADTLPARPSLAAAFVRREPWEMVVDTLEATAHSLATADSPSASADGFKEHLVWQLSFFRGSGFGIEARHISSARAKKGKRVSALRLRDGSLPFMSELDRKVSSHLHEYKVGYYGQSEWEYTPDALKALIAHPQVRLEGKGPVTVVAGQASIEVKTSQGLTTLTLHPAELQNARICAVLVGEDTIEVHERNEELVEVYKLFALSHTLKIPESGRARVLESLANLSVSTGLHISGEDSLQHKVVKADPRVALRLGWDGRVFTIEARCAPLGLDGPLLPLASGHKKVVGRVDQELLRCTRDLAAEVATFEELLAGCPQLASYPEQEGRWEVDELDTALALLEEFNAMSPSVRMMWPEGKRLKLASKVSSASMAVKLRTGKKWLEAQVELTIDEARVLGFKELLARRRANGRFIELDDDRYAVLTGDLKKRLDALEALGVTRASKVELHPVTLALFNDLVIGESEALASVSFDRASRARLDKLEKIAASRPRLPRGFGLSLRDYQAESYRWLVRLGEAGLGAVLADDMGLGKTIQALALLLKRRASGPALVVAPTSVVRNWRSEARRCTPSLRVHLLAESADRHALLKGAKAGDLILCSYGLLVSEAEVLTELEFGSVVFDEAHALKNTRALRTRVAHDLKAGFRLALTGTPVENHLGELWSVMQASVPGLLGSEAAFERRFVKPIARGVREASRALRALIHPFVLRRTKGQVLDELPARTEMTVLVEPGPAERAFYEALRQEAQALLKSKGNTRQAKAKRMRILAEITRLRQAAVDPRLIDPEHGPPGAKIEALIERLVDLKAEGHRALVFSQFRGSLKHARLAMDAAGIEHLGFDGSTPAKARAHAVDAFQDGQADVFLMSLKAGGVGINLTAADYVIHLDPWWNPAVEDQATSRAHRIGQRRPVTVYRLINEGTIEEKILTLHETKRDLADDVLAGLESAGKLDLEQLRALLQA